MDEEDTSPEACLRQALAKLEADGLDAAMVDLLHAKAWGPPGDRRLLVFVKPLVAADRRRLALEILENYVGQHPEDELTVMWLDEHRAADEAREIEEQAAFEAEERAEAEAASRLSSDDEDDDVID